MNMQEEDMKMREEFAYAQITNIDVNIICNMP